MKWSIIAIGKPALAWAKEGVADYLGRLRRTQRVECLFLREGTEDQVAKRVLEASEGSLRVLLDECGRLQRSTELAAWIGKKELGGCKHISILIGGANGHPPAVRLAAQESWSLSPFTLQHELALVVLLEQLYRAASIMRGDPYHREGSLGGT